AGAHCRHAAVLMRHAARLERAALVREMHRAFEVGAAFAPPPHERQRDAALRKHEGLAPQPHRHVVVVFVTLPQLAQTELTVLQRLAQAAGPECGLALSSRTLNWTPTSSTSRAIAFASCR